MTAVHTLVDRLAQANVVDFHIFPGSSPATPEQVAQEVLGAFKALEREDFEFVRTQ
jgi:hypothetical protein